MKWCASFWLSTPPHLASLRKAIASGDAEQIRRIAHLLKGMISVFCVPAVAEVAERIELHRSADLHKELEELQRSFAWLAGELRKTLED